MAHAVHYGSTKALETLLKHDESSDYLRPVKLTGDEKALSAFDRAEHIAALPNSTPKAKRTNGLLYYHDKNKQNTEYRFPGFKIGRIDNLVFQGSGTKGIAYVGALRALSKHLKKRRHGKEDKDGQGDFPGVRRTAGASTGAITALLVACGFTTEEIAKALARAPYKEFFESIDTAQLNKEQGWLKKLSHTFQEMGHVSPYTVWYQAALNTTGLCKGTRILSWLSETIAEKLTAECEKSPKIKQTLLSRLINQEVIEEHKDDAQGLDKLFYGALLQEDKKGTKTLNFAFGDLRGLANIDARFKGLHVMAVRLSPNIEETEKLEIDAINTDEGKWDNVLIVDAIRASLSVPFVFGAWRPRERNKQGKISQWENSPCYISAGLIKNFPLEQFDRFKYSLSAVTHLGDLDWPRPNRHTLGLRIVPKEGAPTAEAQAPEFGALQKEITRLLESKTKESTLSLTKEGAAQLALQLAACYWSAENTIPKFQKNWKGRAIEISDMGVDTLELGLSQAQQEQLACSGQKAVDCYFGGNKDLGARPLSPTLQAFFKAVPPAAIAETTPAPERDEEAGETLKKPTIEIEVKAPPLCVNSNRKLIHFLKEQQPKIDPPFQKLTPAVICNFNPLRLFFILGTFNSRYNDACLKFIF